MIATGRPFQTHAFGTPALGGVRGDFLFLYFFLYHVKAHFQLQLHSKRCLQMSRSARTGRCPETVGSAHPSAAHLQLARTAKSKSILSVLMRQVRYETSYSDRGCRRLVCQPSPFSAPALEGSASSGPVFRSRPQPPHSPRNIASHARGSLFHLLPLDGPLRAIDLDIRATIIVSLRVCLCLARIYKGGF
jgi:hypothetical protein